MTHIAGVLSMNEFRHCVIEHFVTLSVTRMLFVGSELKFNATSRWLENISRQLAPQIQHKQIQLAQENEIIKIKTTKQKSWELNNIFPINVDFSGA